MLRRAQHSEMNKEWEADRVKDRQKKKFCVHLMGISKTGKGERKSLKIMPCNETEASNTISAI